MSRAHRGGGILSGLNFAPALAVAGLLWAVSDAPAGGVVPLRSTRVATGLQLPIYATHAPGDTKRLFIVEKTGKIKILTLATGAVTTFLDINDRVIDLPAGSVSTQENFGKGIMGMAFDPNYATNGYFYLHYYKPSDPVPVAGSDGVIARYQVTADSAVADHDSEFVVWTWDDQNNDHNGGSIDFGPDGFLYITRGDGGTQQDPENDAQNHFSSFGKILRIDVHGRDAYPADPLKNYAIPPTNPWADGVSGLPEILHYGLRNPYRASFDSGTGRYYIADVGQNAREEVDVAPPGATGLNFGWKCSEGFVCPTGFAAGACACGVGLTLPIQDYVDGTANGRSITGGYVYRGCAIPSLRGKYVYGDYTAGSFWYTTYDGLSATPATSIKTQMTPSVEGFTVFKPAAFAEDGRGELYIVRHSSASSINEGEIYKIIPATPTVAAVDLNCDEDVNGLDLASLLAAWGRCPLWSCLADFNGDGFVNGLDLATLLAGWG